MLGTRNIVIAGGLTLGLCMALLSLWVQQPDIPSPHDPDAALNLQHPTTEPILQHLTADSLQDGQFRILHHGPQTPSQEIISRFKCARDTLWIMDMITDQSRKGVAMGLCYSPVYFQEETINSELEEKGIWGVLISSDKPIPQEILNFMRGFMSYNRLCSIDPEARKFVYAFSHRTLSFGRSVLDGGSIVMPSSSSNVPVGSTLVGALYKSSCPTLKTASTTVGGVVMAIREDEQRKYYGITSCPAWDRQPKEPVPDKMPPEQAPAPLLRGPPHSSPHLDRGKREILLSSSSSYHGNSSAYAIRFDDEEDDADAEHSPGDVIQETAKLVASFGSPVCLLELDENTISGLITSSSDGEPSLVNRLQSRPGSKIAIAEDSDMESVDTNTEFIVALASDHFEDLPRLKMVEGEAKVIYPNSGGNWAARFRVLTGLLRPRDIGAWIIVQTPDNSSHFRAFYQLVALGEPDMVYAIAVEPMLRGISPPGVYVLPGTIDHFSYLEAFSWHHTERVGLSP
ncbi:hypothetical protein QBC37DRAFT_482154 [Rhypophila decipiens]|uniref:Uncharacterized protein n=1 Tax=Rhypophila decipiens TaxID=261697 RepID=A0AAN7B8D7_9PEZI|nr:hypothetical protein QBC37DRAFT_482154 [Rhypophila decipiens]